MGSIWDSIKQFGSNVVSGIGTIIAPTTVSSTFVGPPVPTTTSFTNSLGDIYTSAISRIAGWINPPPTAPVTASTASPIYIWGGSKPLAPSTTTSPSGSNASLFGLPQGMGLILVAVGVGYLLFKRGKI